jgi:hypothetical protein
MNLDSLELSKAQKVTLFKLLSQDPDIEDDVQTWFDSMLIKSELKPIKRIAELEAVTGLNDYSDFEEDEAHDPTIPEKINRLDEILSQLYKAEKPDFTDKNLVPPSKNITEIRADYLVDYAITNDLIPKAPPVFANVEVKVIDSKEFRYFAEHILPPEYRPKSNRNLRKMKKDVFEAAKIRYKDKGIDTDPAEHGRHEVRLLYFREKTDEEMKPLIDAFSPQSSLSVTA